MLDPVFGGQGIDWRKMYDFKLVIYVEWVIKFNILSGDSGQQGPYSPYKPCNHSLYIGIIIFPHIDNTQSHLRGDYLGLNIILHSFVIQRLILIKDHTTLSTCWICGYTCKTTIIAHIVPEQGTICWLLTATRYIVLSLISPYHSLDPTIRDISRVHCIWMDPSYLTHYQMWLQFQKQLPEPMMTKS